jgi:hypothetical protein
MRRLAEDVLDGPLLRDLAGVHDDHVVAHLGDHAEVVRDEHDRHAELPLERQHEVEDLRLDRDVERRGRLVGDEERRVAGERHRDHDPLAHAARELVGVFADADLGRGNADLARSVDGLGQRLLLRDRLVQEQDLRQLRPIVWTGFSALSGSWNTIPIRPPRIRCSSPSVARTRSVPSKRICRRGSLPCGCGSRRMIEKAVTLLPQPDSPTIPSVRPLRTSKLTPSTARGPCRRIQIRPPGR